MFAELVRKVGSVVGDNPKVTDCVDRAESFALWNVDEPIMKAAKACGLPVTTFEDDLMWAFHYGQSVANDPEVLLAMADYHDALREADKVIEAFAAEVDRMQGAALQFDCNGSDSTDSKLIGT